MASQYRRRSLMLNTIAKVAQGNPTIINDSSSRRLKRLDIFGQSEQDGTPSIENPIPIISKEVSEIKVTGLNLFNADWIKGFDEYQSQSKNVVSLPKGKYRLSVQGLTETDLKKDAYFAIRIKVDETYTNTYWIMHPSSPNTKCLTGINFDIISDFQINLFIYNDNEEQLQLVYDTLNGHIQLNNNFNAMPYEHYKEQTITLSEPIILRGIPVSSGGNVTINGQQYISDVICEKDGVIGVERNYEETILDGVNNVVKNVDKPDWTELVNCSLWDIRLEKNHYYGGTRKNSLLSILKNEYNNNDYEHFYVTDRLDAYMTLFILDSRLETVDTTSANEWLKQNTPKLLYLLATPTFEPLPEEVQTQYKALKSYYPNTVIQTGCWNEVTYSAKRGG